MMCHVALFTKHCVSQMSDDQMSDDQMSDDQMSDDSQMSDDQMSDDSQMSIGQMFFGQMTRRVFLFQPRRFQRDDGGRRLSQILRHPHRHAEKLGVYIGG